MIVIQNLNSGSIRQNVAYTDNIIHLENLLIYGKQALIGLMQIKWAIISYLKIKEYLCNISCNYDVKRGHIEQINHGIVDAQLTDLL